MNAFEQITWPDGEKLHGAFRARGQSGIPFKNCYIGFTGWAVKVFLGGSQRLLATTRTGVNAARFADMAIVHFHPYRKRRIRPLIDADLNFSLAQAASDAVQVPAAKKILIDLEQRLIAEHAIPAIPEPPAGEAPMRDEVLRASLALEHQKLCNLFSRFQAKFSSVPMARIHLEEFVKTLEHLRIQIRSLDSFFLVPENQPTPTNEQPNPAN